MALEIVLTPMELSPGTFNVGDTLRVTVSFEYTVGINTVVKIYAGPFYTNLFGKHMVDACVGSADVSLTVATEPASQTATVDFILIPEAQGGIDDGTYGLRVWVEDTNAVAEQENVIIVTGNPSSSGSGDMFTAMMPMLMMVMMMGMVMPMTQQMNEGTEEE